MASEPAPERAGERRARACWGVRGAKPLGYRPELAAQNLPEVVLQVHDVIAHQERERRCGVRRQRLKADVLQVVTPDVNARALQSTRLSSSPRSDGRDAHQI